MLLPPSPRRQQTTFCTKKRGEKQKKVVEKQRAVLVVNKRTVTRKFKHTLNDLGQDEANKRERKQTAPIVVISYPLQLAVKMSRYGYLININPSVEKQCRENRLEKKTFNTFSIGIWNQVVECINKLKKKIKPQTVPASP